MANRRMFSLDVVDTDKFLELPASSQSLYFHLGMRADDDGFVSSPKKIANMVNCSIDDLKLLITKNYLIPFENGVVVITDWKINNWVRPDRKQGTRFVKELSMLQIEADVYQLTTECQPNNNQLATECHTEDRLGKDRLGKVKNKYCPNSNEFRLAAYLFNFIKRNNYKAKEPNYQIWSKQFDYILRIDKRDIEEVKQVIKFCQEDSFWYKNILSPDKLRKHFDKLILQMNDTHKSDVQKANRSKELSNEKAKEIPKGLLGWDD